ncbi:putative protein TPRXL [Takifugu rubripes]|uniref:putative protein TPRXL n=1 Tax=Takifugu rubripes TaxID=31033 RepID=UPI00114604E7|nr:putative protein TPRXL [Takifugu rubripes]
MDSYLGRFYSLFVYFVLIYQAHLSWSVKRENFSSQFNNGSTSIKQPKWDTTSQGGQPSPPPGGQLRVNWSAGSNVTSNGTSSWTLSSNQASQTPSTSPNRLLGSAASSSQNATELKSNRSQTSSKFSTKSPDTPTPSGRSPPSTNLLSRRMLNRQLKRHNSTQLGPAH